MRIHGLTEQIGLGRRSGSRHFDQPAADQGQQIGLLPSIQRAARLEPMPLGDTAATAAGRGMLGDKHRMTTPWGLLAVTQGLRRRQTAGDEIGGVLQHPIQALVLQIGLILGIKTKAGPEARGPQPAPADFIHDGQG